MVKFQPHAAVSRSERPLRIVVIEPRTEVGYVAKRFLEFAGHEVYYAVDGFTGVELVANHLPDVVTTSIAIPGLDGFEVAREISRRMEVKPRLVATTSYSKSAIGDRLKEAGFDCYLAKPFPRELLMVAVEADQSALPEELRL